MAQSGERTDIPVILLHNVDPAWEIGEAAEAVGAVCRLASALAQQGHPVVNIAVADDDVAGRLAPFDPNGYVILNWCEELPGLPRSDARVARVLESLGFTFTGAGSDVLQSNWDKAAGKTLLDKCGVPTPVWQVFSTAADSGDWRRFPAIVKPAFEHCSVGITTDAVVLNAAELDARLRFVLDAYRQPALVEDFIDGRELHLTLWGNGAVEVLPPAEMDFSAFENLRDRLCTYDSKFKPGSTHYETIELRIPAPLTEREQALVRQTALNAYRVTGCRDYARIDLRLRDHRCYVLDVNPNADLSPDTSTAYSAEAAGLSYGAFGSRLVNLAAGRHPVFAGRHPGEAEAQPSS